MDILGKLDTDIIPVDSFDYNEDLPVGAMCPRLSVDDCITQLLFKVSDVYNERHEGHRGSESIERFIDYIATRNCSFQ